MEMKLRIANNFTLPPESVTETFAILGIRGSGKTNTGVVITEELLAANQQVVIIDPVDVWWGLKSSKDGKAPGYPLPVIGGDHADVPLDGAAGVVLADFVTDTRASVILSLRNLSMNDQRRFAGDFAKRLYERKGQQRSPLMLMVDEADEFVPQRVPKGHEGTFGAFDRLVRRGRSSGIGVTLISQRAQVINKDVLSQMGTLVGMRVLHKLDRKALEAWIEAHDTEGRQEEFMASLASLGRGDAWIWSPSWLGVFERIHVRERHTYDSSATPKAGDKIAPPKELAAIDLEGLREKMASTIEKAKQDDPKTLRARIIQLEKELSKKAPAAGVSAVSAAEMQLRADAAKWQQILERANERAAALAQALKDAVGAVTHAYATVTDLDAAARKITKAHAGVPPPTRVATPLPAKTERPRTEPTRTGPTNGSAHLPAGERSVLTACAQYPEGAGREQLTILTGYKRSTRDAYIQRLRERGFVEAAGSAVVATDAGVAALGPGFEPLPTGEALRAYWLNRLPEGERKILEVLIGNPGVNVDRDHLQELIGYKRSTRDAYIQRLKARQLVEITGRGEVKANEVLFE